MRQEGNEECVRVAILARRFGFVRYPPGVGEEFGLELIFAFATKAPLLLWRLPNLEEGYQISSLPFFHGDYSLINLTSCLQAYIYVQMP